MKRRAIPLKRTPIFEPLESRRLLQATPQGAEFRVNSTTTGDQFAPAVARDLAGNFVVAWASEESDPTDTSVYAQRYNSFGTPQGGQFRVNTFTTGIQTRPAIAMDSDGDFVVVWQSGTSNSGIFPGQDGSGSGVYAQRFNSLGIAQGGEFRVNSVTTSDQDAPAVAMDGSGNFVVAWNNFNGDGNGVGVYAQRYNSTGTPQGGEFRANSFTTNTQIDPSVAMAGNGTSFVIAWSSGTLASPGGQDGSFYGVYAQRYNGAGVVQGGEFKVNTATADFQTDASVAMDSDGDFVVAWNSFAQDGSDYGIYAQRYNAAGAPQGAEFRVNTFTPGAQSDPRVSMTPAGNFVVVWGSTAQDGSGRGVYGQQYNANGTLDGGEFRVNVTTVNNQNRPAVAMNNAGDYIAVFQDGSTTPNVNGQDGSGYGVYARRYTVAVDAIAPRVTAGAFNFLTSHSLTFSFNENVSASLTTSDIVVFNQTTGSPVATASMALSYNGGTNTATVTFPGLTGALLTDGNYQATLVAAGITDPAGNQLDGNGDGTPGDNFVLSFFFLNGDASRDGRVTLTDFNILAGNFGQSGRDFTQGNFNYDAGGQVTLQDFNVLAGRFGQALFAPSGTGASGSSFGTSRTRDSDEEDAIV
jgi:hypothetical protein